jgi:hypothetical protein
VGCCQGLARLVPYPYFSLTRTMCSCNAWQHSLNILGYPRISRDMG